MFASVHFVTVVKWNFCSENIIRLIAKWICNAVQIEGTCDGAVFAGRSRKSQRNGFLRRAKNSNCKDTRFIWWNGARRSDRLNCACCKWICKCMCHVTLKLAVSRSRPLVPYGANLWDYKIWLYNLIRGPVSVAQWANPHEPQCATRPDWLVTATGPGSTPGLGLSFSASWTISRHALRLSLG